MRGVSGDVLQAERGVVFRGLATAGSEGTGTARRTLGPTAIARGTPGRLASARRAVKRVHARLDALSTPRRLGAPLPLVGGKEKGDTRRPRTNDQRAGEALAV
jgi:hypothetical protein